MKRIDFPQQIIALVNEREHFWPTQYWYASARERISYVLFLLTSESRSKTASASVGVILHVYRVVHRRGSSV
jgi:hypothetical protein